MFAFFKLRKRKQLLLESKQRRKNTLQNRSLIKNRKLNSDAEEQDFSQQKSGEAVKTQLIIPYLNVELKRVYVSQIGKLGGAVNYIVGNQCAFSLINNSRTICPNKKGDLCL